jgi:hypothetical protein
MCILKTCPGEALLSVERGCRGCVFQAIDDSIHHALLLMRLGFVFDFAYKKYKIVKSLKLVPFLLLSLSFEDGRVEGIVIWKGRPEQLETKESPADAL